jgi:glycerol uptake facilitator-like aquaporin
MASEAVGAGLLLYVIAGSGLAVERLGADPADALFFHAIAAGVALGVLIALFANTSGSHFNPAVTLAMWRRGSLSGSTATQYVLAQVVGAFLGVWLALATFGRSMTISTAETTRWESALSELVGTTVLVLLILGAVDQGRTSWIPGLAGGWVAAMVFSSSSTGFLNPAVTLARSFTDSYTGISPTTAPLYVIAQLTGALIAVFLSTRLLAPPDLKGA